MFRDFSLTQQTAYHSRIMGDVLPVERQGGREIMADLASLKRLKENLLTTERPYPTWICFPCGERFGRRPAGVCTVHNDECGICGEMVPVTEPRDFGHLQNNWREKSNFLVDSH